MKKIILIITLLISLLFSVNSQTFNPIFDPINGPNIFTCNGIPIETRVITNVPSAPEIASLKNQLLALLGTAVLGPVYGLKEEDFIGPVSTLYNCHGYTWHLTEGHTNKVWINGLTTNNTANLNKYWTGSDACFVEIPATMEASAEKIFYSVNYAHSAVKSSVPDKYISKWGWFHLVEHYPTTVPPGYFGSVRSYYIKKGPHINGPSSVCVGSSATFTAVNFPGTVIWTCSPMTEAVLEQYMYSTNSDLTFDVRLYDSYGTLLRQEKTKDGKIEFNVSNVPNGLYYLHVYIGINERPEMRQIIVRH